MLKNLLTKKLYQFTILFLILAFSQSQVEAMVKDEKTECWVPENYGTASEEVVQLTFLSNDARCDFKVPDNYIPNDFAAIKEPRRGICAKALKCIGGGLFTTTFPGESMYFLADPGLDSKISGALTSTGTSMGGTFDTAYKTLDACQRANPNRVVGFIPPVTGAGVFTKFNTLDACKTDYNSNLPTTIGNPQNNPTVSGSCYYVPQGTYLNSALTLNADENYCSCRKCSVINIIDISICWGLTSAQVAGVGFVNDIQTFNSGTTLKQNLDACEAAHPDRFQNKKTRQCYRTLDSCNQASTGVCDPRDENKYFVKSSSGNWEEKTFDQVKSSYANTASRCACSTSYNPNFDVLYCTANPTDTFRCSKLCKYVAVNLSTLQPVKISSPLALINVVVNFLFWLAVVIFVINILSAALDYIKSGDQPDKLKDASDRITGTIFGFVFLLVASGVINYIIARIKDFGL